MWADIIKNMLTRFAPSPTGLIHLGNIRTALICYLYARKNDGKFMLRIDDTDAASCKEEYKEYIKMDLSWLGINWDIITYQSERFERYDELFNELLQSRRIYKCYETAEELEIQRKILISRGVPPIYTKPSIVEIKKYEEEGRNPHFRFKIDSDQLISWYDEIKGEINFSSSNLSDPVVMRTNGLYTYMLPSVIDDIDYKITNIVRGEDHVSNTAVQIQMMKALNAKIPQFAHLSLLKTGGEKLSKRNKSININSLKESGVEPMAINSYLATIGSSHEMREYQNLDQLIQSFNIKKFSSSSILLNLQDVQSLNEKVIRNMPFNEVFPRIRIENLTKEFWQAIKFNIKRLEEVQYWWRICKTNVKPIIVDNDFIKIAYENLPIGDWNEETWGNWINKLRGITGRKGKDLFMPLRLALTGEETGPELAKLLPLIGREMVVSRFTFNA